MSYLISNAARRFFASTLSIALVLAGAVVLPAAPAFAAGPAITVGKDAPSTALVGDGWTYTLTAANPGAPTNPDAVTEYNLSFRDMLPIGVSYLPGSTSPVGAGEPVVRTVGVVPNTQQVLNWSNVADLQVNSTSRLAFKVTSNATALPVGSTPANTANAYVNIDPRLVPKFNSSGAAVAGSYTQTASSPAKSTLITAIKINKSEPSPEGELVRGVHDNPTIYTLKVTNNTKQATNAVTVTDYLPAQLEFLGCGGVDNSSDREFPGAPSLTATPTLPGVDCPTPVSVETVQNPVVVPPLPAGVYTKVVWNLGNLAAGAVRSIQYRAGIPLLANVMFGAPAPSPTGLTQASNLDNNTGASTRETTTEQALTNHAGVAGTYTGPVTAGTSKDVSDHDELTRTAEDLAVAKSTPTESFKIGGIVDYTLTVRGSEYVSSSDVVLTDVIPNGLCPLDDVANYAPLAPATCDPSPTFAPTATVKVPGSAATTVPIAYNVVVANGDGTFSVTFTSIQVPTNGTVTIDYRARMRDTYRISLDPTVSGDSFTNKVSLTGSTTPIAGTGEAGSQAVIDESSTTITADEPTIQKRTLPNTVTPYACSSGTYRDSAAGPAAEFMFHAGDRICFELKVDFSSANNTRNPVVTDFLPAGTTYDPGSVVLTGANTAPGVLFNEAAAITGANPTWTMGGVRGSNKFVPLGSVFAARLAVIVTAPAAAGQVDVPGNLMKFRAENTSGQAWSLRDSQDVQIAPAPPIKVIKGVERVNSGPTNGPNSNVDHVKVGQGDVVRFRIDLTNTGVAANGTNVPVFAPDVWDVLPVGITCSQITAISDAGVCTNPGDAGQPTFTGNGTRSAIRWLLPTTVVLTPGAATPRTLTYDMTVPTPTSVSTQFSNTAHVRSYQANTNIPSPPAANVVTYFPGSNIDSTLPVDQQRAPVATDPSDIYLPDVAVTKSQTTSITETGNNLLTQATIGELVTYTLSATVPSKTTVYNATLTDTLPAGLTFQSATAAYSATGTPPAAAPLPAGVVLNTATGKLTWPATYSNLTATDQLFQVTLIAQVSLALTNRHGVNLTNTVVFRSTPTSADSTPWPNRTASSRTTVVEPAPSVTKTPNPNRDLAAGDTVTYTLNVGNSSTRPPLHDTVVVDCLPAGLVFAAYGTLPGGVTTVPAVLNGCAGGGTQLEWQVGSLAGGATTMLTYTAKVSPVATGSLTYTNTVVVTGSSILGSVTGERQYQASTTANVTVAAARITKSVSPSAAAVGDTVTYTVTGVFPKDINFYNAALIDTIPAGLTAITAQSISCDFAPCPVLPGAQLAPAGSDIGWYVGDMAAAVVDRTVTIIYTARVAAVPSNTRGVLLTNSATTKWNDSHKTPPTSTGDTFDRTTGAAAATVTVLEPHVVLTKAVSTGTPAPGDTFTYTVTATNTGAANLSTAYNVSVVDTVPAGVFVGTINDGGVLTGSGTDGGGTITWTLPALAAAGSQTLTYQASLAPSQFIDTSALVNTVDATYTSQPTGKPDNRLYDDVDAKTATVTPGFPKVTPTKSAVSASPTYIGDDFTWQVTLTSTGATTAYKVDAVDTLPENWTYRANSAAVSVNGAPTQQIEPGVSGRILTWTNLGTIAPGQSIVITLTAASTSAVVTAPGVGAGVAHVNSVATTAQDATGKTGNKTGPYNDSPASAQTRIDSADVQVVKTVDTPFVAGATGKWNLLVSNNGSDTAVGPFVVRDTLPAGQTFVSAIGTGWTCTYDVGTRLIECTRTVAGNTLASGMAFPAIAVAASLAADVASGTSYTNTAAVTARTFDPTPGNNTSTTTTTLTTQADLGVVKALSPAGAALVPGALATYVIDVTNLGPSVAGAPVRIVDTLPTGSTYDSAVGTGWTCAQAAGIVTCERGELAVGAAPQITVKVLIAASQTSAVVNTVTVTSPTPDPVPGNNTDTVTTPPGPSADLRLTKTHVGDIVPGTNGTYRFVTNNDGPSDAAGPLALTDTLPTGVSFVAVSGTPDGWSCTTAGADLTCARTSGLAAGTATAFEITVAIDSGATGDVVNTATVTSPTPDPNPANNTDTDESGTSGKADLALEKTAVVADVIAGGQAEFQLQVRNNGPSTAQGTIVVSDVLPAGLSYDPARPATGTGWTCGYDTASRTLSCARAVGLGSGLSAPLIKVPVDVDSDAGPATIKNIASVTGPTPDPTPGNNVDDAELIVTDEAAVTLTKTRNETGPVVAGKTATYTLSVRNAGPSDADAVHVVDTLPTGLVATAAAGTGWTCTVAPATVTCDRPVLGAGKTSTINVTAQVQSWVADGTNLVNMATETNATTDSPSKDSATTPVVREADLRLVKTHREQNVRAGQPVTFDLVVHNIGASDAAAPVRVVDTLPAGMTFQSTASGAWTCTAGAPVDAGQQVSCALAGDVEVAAGADAPKLTLVVVVDADASAGDYRNSATVTSPTTDPTPGNNTDDDVVPVGVEADLAVVKSHTGPVRVGDDLTFTLHVSNNGPSAARQVVVTDPLPTGLTYVSATGPAGWTCTQATGTISCASAGLAVGGEADLAVTVKVTAAAYPKASNIATVGSDTPDPNPGNNTSTDQVLVPPLVDLAITKSHTGDLVVGKPGTYTMVVTNNGPTADPGPVTVNDTLPTGLAYVGATGAGWTCTADGQLVGCVRSGGLAVGVSSTITLTVDVLASAYPSVTNSVSVGSPAQDTDPSNNTATDPGPVRAVVDLVLAKTLQGFDRLTGLAGWRLTVTNNGPSSTVEPVVVVDNLPAGLTYRSSTGPGFRCAAVGQVVTCTHPGAVAAGQQADVELVTAVDAVGGTTITNTATITGGYGDGPRPPSASDYLTVPSPTPLPHTGTEAVAMALVALVLLVLGATFRLTGRRREQA